MSTIRARDRDIPALDGYRAIASLLVLTTHVGFATGAILWPGLGPVVGRMDFGVALFFLLSGFLLSQPWLEAGERTRGRPATRTYLRRRAARILPAYWIAMVAALVLLPANASATAADWVRYTFLVQIYSDPTVHGGLTHLWSLSVEVSFYLVLPVLMWAVLRPTTCAAVPARRVGLFLASLLVLGLLSRALALGPAQPTGLGLWLPSYLDWFAAGMIAAYARVVRRRATPPRWATTLHTMASDTGTAVMVGGLLLVVGLTPVAGPVTLDHPTIWQGVVKHALYGGAAFFLLLPAFLGPASGRFSRVMSSGPLRRLGTISYGIFLWHLLLLELLQPALGLSLFSGGFWILWPVTVVASVLVATVSWFLVEKPVLTRAHATARMRATPDLPDASPAHRR
jgi:peptidoglycan/LPS O-acetylase OafA/YrhL